MNKLTWTEEMVGELHTGKWNTNRGGYAFIECISTGTLYWTVGDFTMKILHPKGEQYGWEFEDAKKVVENHHRELMSHYAIRG